jgi:hypothetical protein
VTPFQLGCPSHTRSAKTSANVEKEDDLAIVRETLRKGAKLDACKNAVAQLNVYVAQPIESKPQPLSSSERDLLTQRFGFSQDDLNEISRQEFTTLDAHYFENCFLFHDAVRSLNLDLADPSKMGLLKRAELAFAWAMREVWPNERPTQPLPPSYALHMGFGSMADRIAVALAAFQQAGVDAGIVGTVSAGKLTRPWAVGVLTGDDVCLFDFRSGEPVMAKSRREPLTLKQARAEPDLVKELVVTPNGPADIKSIVADSQVWLSPPLSSLAPRMRWLQGVLNMNPPVTLGVDLDAQSKRFSKSGEKVGFLGSPEELSAPLRILSSFLPIAEGGRDRAPQGQRAFDRYSQFVIPLEMLPPLMRSDEMSQDTKEKLAYGFSKRFIDLAFGPGEPRDLLLRGEFDEASRGLVEKLTQIDRVKQQLAVMSDLESDVKNWLRDMRAAETEFARIKNGRKEGDLDAAKGRIETLYKSASKFAYYIEQFASEPYKGAITYQLALCKHEQAERQSRDRGSASAHRDAWQDAVSSWSNFLDEFASASWVPKAQVAHARKMLAIAQQKVTASAEAKSH